MTSNFFGTELGSFFEILSLSRHLRRIFESVSIIVIDRQSDPKKACNLLLCFQNNTVQRDPIRRYLPTYLPTYLTC